MTLDRASDFGQPAHPRVHEDPAVKLTGYPGTVRQLIVTGLGRDAPTVIITNDRDTTTRNLISQYARRMTIEQRLAEIIRAFCADALSSTVNLNVDLDIMLAVLAQALTRRAPRPAARLRRRHPRRHPAPLPGNPRHRSPPPATPSPSASNAAPTHPSCAKPSLPARHPPAFQCADRGWRDGCELKSLPDPPGRLTGEGAAGLSPLIS